MTGALQETNDDLARKLGEARLLIAEMAASLKDCSDDLESELNARTPEEMRVYPVMDRRYQRDMDAVRVARALLQVYQDRKDQP